MSRDKLMALLWPEADAESGQNLLRVALHALRRVLGSEALLSYGPVIRLDVRRLTVDVIEFEAAFNAGRIQEAVALYRGPFLDGFHLSDAPEFDRWMDTQRSALQQKCLSALRAAAEGCARHGAHREAVDWWKRAAALEPYDSTIAVALVRSLGNAGDIAGAIRHARTHTRLLEVDLGVPAPPAMVELESRLRDPAARAAFPQEPSPPAPEVSAGGRKPLVPPPAESDRRRKPNVSSVLAGAVVLMIGVFVGSVVARGTEDSELISNRVLVLPLRSERSDSQSRTVARLSADVITDGLQRSGVVEVIDAYTAFGLHGETDSLPAATGNDSVNRMRTIASRVKAGKLVWGSIRPVDSLFDVRIVITDAADGRVLRVLDPILMKPSQLRDGLSEIQARTVGAVASAVDQRINSLVSSSSPPPSFEAYHEFVNGLDRFREGRWSAAS